MLHLQVLTTSSQTKVTTTYHAAESGKGKLTVKTYDPVSGAIIKFRTSKIAIVGRMMAGLNRLGRQQANVSEPVVVGITPIILLLHDIDKLPLMKWILQTHRWRTQPRPLQLHLV